MIDYEGLGGRVAETTSKVPDEDLNRVRASFLDRARPRRRRWIWYAALFVCGSAAVAGGYVGYRQLQLHHTAPESTSEDLWLEGPKYGAPTRVELGSGAHLDLLAGTRARVHRLAGGENRVTLEGGVIEVLVSQSSSHDWSFYAGPYLITTTGSEFFLNYQPAMGTLEVGVRAGQTQVNGGQLGRDSLAVGEGQRLTAGGGSVTVGTLQREDPAESEQPSP